MIRLKSLVCIWFRQVIIGFTLCSAGFHKLAGCRLVHDSSLVTGFMGGENTNIRGSCQIVAEAGCNGFAAFDLRVVDDLRAVFIEERYSGISSFLQLHAVVEGYFNVCRFGKLYRLIVIYKLHVEESCIIQIGQFCFIKESHSFVVVLTLFLDLKILLIELSPDLSEVLIILICAIFDFVYIQHSTCRHLSVIVEGSCDRVSIALEHQRRFCCTFIFIDDLFNNLFSCINFCRFVSIR